MKFRIKQVDHNIYIPQVKNNFFSSWCAIDNKWDTLWNINEFQTRYCGHKTYADALREIEIWKIKIHFKRHFPKYYEI